MNGLNKAAEAAAYSIGPLLYTPGLKKDIAKKIYSYKAKGLMSSAICLEDTVKDDMVEQAEKNTVSEIREYRRILEENGEQAGDYLNVFIRVRDSEQIYKLTDMLGDDIECLRGFIIPKIDDETIVPYIDVVGSINKNRDKTVYIMPIIENPSLISAYSRQEKLHVLYSQLECIKKYILNIRIGGNDFCNALGILNDVTETIYDIPPIVSLLSDISVTFTSEYVVSAPVWNYFDNGTNDLWLRGMLREMKKDRAMGFIGKTIIHPSQIAPAIESMKVTENEYNDAKRIIETSGNSIQVLKNTLGNRMFETKVHTKWAERTLKLASIYGVKKNGPSEN